jgi:hypothetical protein
MAPPRRLGVERKGRETEGQQGSPGAEGWEIPLVRRPGRLAPRGLTWVRPRCLSVNRLRVLHGAPGRENPVASVAGLLQRWRVPALSREPGRYVSPREVFADSAPPQPERERGPAAAASGSPCSHSFTREDISGSALWGAGADDLAAELELEELLGEVRLMALLVVVARLRSAEWPALGGSASASAWLLRSVLSRFPSEPLRESFPVCSARRTQTPPCPDARLLTRTYTNPIVKCLWINTLF